MKLFTDVKQIVQETYIEVMQPLTVSMCETMGKVGVGKVGG